MDKKSKIFVRGKAGLPLCYSYVSAGVALFIALLNFDFEVLLVIVAIVVVMFLWGKSLYIFREVWYIMVVFPVVLSHDYIQKRFLVFLHPGNGEDERAISHTITHHYGKWSFGSRSWGIGTGHGWSRNSVGHYFCCCWGRARIFRIIFLWSVCSFRLLDTKSQKCLKSFWNVSCCRNSPCMGSPFQALWICYATLCMFPYHWRTLPFISLSGSSPFSFASSVLPRLVNFLPGHAHHSVPPADHGHFLHLP